MMQHQRNSERSSFFAGSNANFQDIIGDGGNMMYNGHDEEDQERVPLLGDNDDAGEDVLGQERVEGFILEDGNIQEMRQVR